MHSYHYDNLVTAVSLLTNLTKKPRKKSTCLHCKLLRMPERLSFLKWLAILVRTPKPQKIFAIWHVPPPKKNFKWGNFGISGSKSNFQDWRQVKILDPPLVIFSGSFSKFPPATFTPRTRSDRTPRQCPCCLPDVPGVTKATTSNNFKLLGHGMA